MFLALLLSLSVVLATLAAVTAIGIVWPREFAVRQYIEVVGDHHWVREHAYLFDSRPRAD
jgi:hypothetical protein